MFTEKLAKNSSAYSSSKDPVPGGGGASALVGAVEWRWEVWLEILHWVKRNIESYQEDIKAILQKAAKIQEELILLVERMLRSLNHYQKHTGFRKNTEEEKAKQGKR